MSKRLFTTGVLVCGFMVCLAAALADLTGKWTGSIAGPDGQDIVLTYNIKVDGDKITGTGESEGVAVNIDDGKITGNDLTFSVTNSEGIVVKHKGRYYAEGDSIAMNIDINSAKLHFKLTRNK